MVKSISRAFGATGCLVLIGCGGSGQQDSGVSSSIATNVAPVVDAGPDQVVDERTPIELNGSVTDPDSTVSFEWTQVSGPVVQIVMPNALNAVTFAQSVREDSDIVLELTADDGVNSPVSDRITIRVQNVSNGPEGPSSQGTSDGTRTKRENALRERDTRQMFGTREVRTYDGSKNNVANPEWGASFIHLQRLATADYTDDISSLAGALRPSARLVSNEVVHQDENETIPNTVRGTDMVWQWGQFIDHDLDLTDGLEEAAPIAVPQNDPWFDPDGLSGQTISFNRALFDPDTGTSVSNPREQENEITAWIDGSMIYGSDEDRAAALRVGSNSPFLKTSSGNLLPFNEDALTNANGFVTDGTTLFVAGDIRANEQLGLATLHTLFVREHNRLAAELQQDFPTQPADEIFEATRRLVVAKLQRITYEEWLPVLIGADAIPAYSGYDASINPSIFNEFSVAAFRLGHSMLNAQLLRLDASGAEVEGGHVSLAQAFFTAPQILVDEDSLDPILRGLSTQLHQEIDQKIVHDVRNFLFGAPGDGGLDLASLNIQRGRDHGVPSYTAMRDALGLAAVTTFSDITSDAALATSLEQTYGSVDDIDLWVGGLAEDAFAGSQLGETFHTILVRQFTALRDGDRFWYERDLNASELQRVEDATLATIIRDNTGVSSELQDNVFIAP